MIKTYFIIYLLSLNKWLNGKYINLLLNKKIWTYYSMKKLGKYNFDEDSMLEIIKMSEQIDIRNILCKLCKYKKPIGIKLLLEYSKIDLPDFYGDPNHPIILAIKYNNMEIVELLFEYYPPIDISYYNYICGCNIADHNNCIELVNLLFIYSGIDLSIDDNFALKIACKNGHKNIVKLLLEYNYSNVDPSASDNAAISIAYNNNHIKIANLLLLHPKVKLGSLYI